MLHVGNIFFSFYVQLLTYKLFSGILSSFQLGLNSWSTLLGTAGETSPAGTS